MIRWHLMFFGPAVWLLIIFGVSSEKKEDLIICIGKDILTDEIAERVNCTTSFATFTEANLKETLSSNTTVILTDECAVIKEKISIKRKDNVQIIGGLGRSWKNSTQIFCDSENVGLVFTHVKNLTLSNLSIINCGGRWLKNDASSDLDYIQSAVYLVNCLDINIDSIAIEGSKGHRGLTMIDCFKQVHIHHLLITNNHTANESGTGGLYIEMEQNDEAVYQINECQFLNNRISNFSNETMSDADIPKMIHEDRLNGGGVAIRVGGSSYGNQVSIMDCLFRGNVAEFGGGLNIQIVNNASGTAITLERIHFHGNSAFRGGGGLGIRMAILNPNTPENNEVRVFNSVFDGNNAHWGGGTSFFAELSYKDNLENSVFFGNCSWKRNLASIGSAISAIPPSIIHILGSFPVTIEMSNCSFHSNIATDNTLNSAVYTRLIPVVVNNTTSFEANKGSGMIFVDSSIIVKENAFLSFVGNSGSFGGGLFLLGLSKIITEENVTLIFTDNQAYFRGGGIYFYSLHALFSIDTRTCFIEHASHFNSSFWPRLYFSGNKAFQGYSHSMFLSSLVPCNCSLNSDQVLIDVFENCIGSFTFEDGNITLQVETIGSEFFNRTDQSDEIHPIPGRNTRLPFEIHDQLGHESFAVLLLALNEQTRNTSTSLKQSITANNMVTLLGQPHEKSSLQINSLFQKMTKEVIVVMSECPPGYINVNDSCICSSHVPDEQYRTIIRCDYGDMKSYIINGFWAGYVTNVDEQPGEDNLYISECPFGYCYDNTVNENVEYKTQLPGEASKTKLDETICQKLNRTGILCGNCIKGYSVYYHSPKDRCGPYTRYCNYGVIFYFLSELLPVTLLFTVVMLNGVNFNSGKLNGFVLFAQLLKSISTAANGAIKYNKTELFFHNLRVLLYEPFNLNFFEAEFLSFCIHKKANFLVLVAVQFATLIYSLTLVIILVVLMNSKHCYKLQKACFKLKKGITKQSSLTNGLAAFFTLCYSNAARLSFGVLNAGQLIGKGEKQLLPLRVFRMGDIVYFSGIHIPFAVVAIGILVTIVFIPPVLLIIYPVGLKIVPEKVQQKQPLRWLIHKAGLYMVLFDSFQGCFKDKHRYFAGLYFIYRSAFLATFAYIGSTLVFISVNQIILLMMLSLHLWIQPYKQQIHNMIDGLLFLFLALINTFTLWRYFQSYTEGGETEILGLGVAQLILIYIPGVTFVLYILLQFIHNKLSRRIQKKEINTSSTTLLDSSSYHRQLDY